MTEHIPVLLHETVDGLALATGDIVIDGTVGGGSHSKEICKHIGASGVLIGIDADSTTLERARKALAGCTAQVHLTQNNFRNIDEAARQAGNATPNKILLDLGISSFDIEVSGRGFSFQKDEPLLMTLADMIDESTVTAQEIVNEWAEESIADILYGFGEERFSRRIAGAIVQARKEKRIESTSDLVTIIEGAVPGWYRNKRTHPATKTFQALRIAVNDEMGALSEVLEKGFNMLASGGRFAIISFHSLEDRMVKQFFIEKEKSGLAKRVTKKPITPSEKELEHNKRARSAKLRILEKN